MTEFTTGPIVKKQTLTTLGRRNKQQILRDFVRPTPASTISAPDLGITLGSGFLGECGAGIPLEPTGTNTIGFFAEELVNNSGTFTPSLVPSYYTDVYFDGVRVEQTDHYTLDTNNGIIPLLGNNPEIVQARYVVR